jgi:tetratricopeptide (TPR) repeat protein
LPGTKINEAWRKAAAAGDWPLALLHVRADLAQYVIWHRRHTVPNLQIPGLPQPDMYSIDVAALSEYIGHLVEVLARLNRLPQAPPVLGRLAHAIDDPRWRRKIAYHRGIVALLGNDRVKARHELAAAGPITPQDDDVDLLQIHVDLNGSKMGFTERQAFYEQIVTVTRSRSDRIQYRGAATFDLLLVGDEMAGRIALKALISDARAMEVDKPLSPTAETWFCNVLEMLAVLDEDRVLYTELLARLERLLISETWTALGKARLWRSIGDAHRHSGDYAKAVNAYRTADTLVPDAIHKVFEAECLLRGGHVADALDLIQTIPVGHLSPAEQADHAFVYFYIALAAKDRAALNQAGHLLRAASTPQPYFETRRLQYIVAVQDALGALATNDEPPKLGGFLGALRAFSRYVQLQPNFNGVGFNLNNLIDDVVEAAEKRSRS